MTTQKLISLGDLEVLSLPGNPKLGALVMLHGYGANAFDLAPLKEIPGPLQNLNWYLPQAPLDLPFTGFDSKAWFPLNEELMHQRLRGETVGLGNYDPFEFREASEKLRRLYHILRETHPSVILAGFSQGAMMAIDSYLEEREKLISGIILMSTAPLAWSRWEHRLPEASSLPFLFQSHGKSDSLLPFDHAKFLFEKIKDKTSHRQFTAFQGGHEIPPRIWQELGEFLKKSESLKFLFLIISFCFTLGLPTAYGFCPSFDGIYELNPPPEGYRKLNISYNFQTHHQNSHSQIGRQNFLKGLWVAIFSDGRCEEKEVSFRPKAGRCLALSTYSDDEVFEVLAFKNSGPSQNMRILWRDGIYTLDKTELPSLKGCSKWQGHYPGSAFPVGPVTRP